MGSCMSAKNGTVKLNATAGDSMRKSATGGDFKKSHEI